MSNDIRQDIQELQPGALVELFILDCSNFGGSVYYFHNNGDASPTVGIWFQGNKYTPFPIQASGFECNGRGQANRPKLSTANVTGLISELCELYDDLVGAKLTRKRTFAKYLDTEPSADPSAELPEEIYYIEQKTIETREMVEYELTGIWDMDGIKLPKRQVCATACMSGYRSSECGYTGLPVAKADDTPTTNTDEDVCGKRVSSCKLRFGAHGVLPFGGFPAVGRLS